MVNLPKLNQRCSEHFFAYYYREIVYKYQKLSRLFLF